MMMQVPRRAQSNRAIAGATTLIVIGLIGLVGCAPNVNAKSEPIETSIKTPESELTSPPTNTPEKPSQEVLNINYASFENWDNLSEREKRTACEGFYATNPVESDVIQSENNTGIEIAEYFDAKLQRIYETYMNETNDKNVPVSKALIECATTPGVDGGGARGDIQYKMNELYHSSFGEVRNNIGSVTRYSDGLQVAVGGASTILYKVVEFYEVSVDTPDYKELRQGVFEWTKDYGWREVLELPGDASVKYGNNPPVIVDQSRANAPWQG